MGVEAARLELNRIKGMFVFMPVTPDVYDRWEELVFHYEVMGKPAHDARLVAAMRAHRISTILTFDRSGFLRYEEIRVIHPLDALG
jgi:predicted nucleic acid-binding protein